MSHDREWYSRFSRTENDEHSKDSRFLVNRSKVMKVTHLQTGSQIYVNTFFMETQNRKKVGEKIVLHITLVLQLKL